VIDFMPRRVEGPPRMMRIVAGLRGRVSMRMELSLRPARGHFVSFANCGLPYHIGGAIPERDSLLLQTPESLAESLALDVRTGREVTGIDRDAKEVEVRDVREDRTYRESYDQARALSGRAAGPAADPGRR
jgi:NADPH-dependent 2,4-dienoyl-CoA reductase/sulfur reductase-like enzyme